MAAAALGNFAAINYRFPVEGHPGTMSSAPFPLSTSSTSPGHHPFALEPQQHQQHRQQQQQQQQQHQLQAHGEAAVPSLAALRGAAAVKAMSAHTELAQYLHQLEDQASVLQRTQETSAIARSVHSIAAKSATGEPGAAASRRSRRGAASRSRSRSRSTTPSEDPSAAAAAAVARAATPSGSGSGGDPGGLAVPVQANAAGAQALPRLLTRSRSAEAGLSTQPIIESHSTAATLGGNHYHHHHQQQQQQYLLQHQQQQQQPPHAAVLAANTNNTVTNDTGSVHHVPASKPAGLVAPRRIDSQQQLLQQQLLQQPSPSPSSSLYQSAPSLFPTPRPSPGGSPTSETQRPTSNTSTLTPESPLNPLQYRTAGLTTTHSPSPYHPRPNTQKPLPENPPQRHPSPSPLQKSSSFPETQSSYLQQQQQQQQHHHLLHPALQYRHHNIKHATPPQTPPSPLQQSLQMAPSPAPQPAPAAAAAHSPHQSPALVPSQLFPPHLTGSGSGSGLYPQLATPTTPHTPTPSTWSSASSSSDGSAGRRRSDDAMWRPLPPPPTPTPTPTTAAAAPRGPARHRYTPQVIAEVIPAAAGAAPAAEDGGNGGGGGVKRWAAGLVKTGGVGGKVGGISGRATRRSRSADPGGVVVFYGAAAADPPPAADAWRHVGPEREAAGAMGQQEVPRQSGEGSRGRTEKKGLRLFTFETSA
ncbi:hypothetical protein DFJ73DRAFT_772358 [Zopfochytrium polystomum]|nr:hypothetical protein DFJ73DRAFT_772358 [Zopfochytrium polystomum]